MTLVINNEYIFLKFYEHGEKNLHPKISFKQTSYTYLCFLNRVNPLIKI